MVVLGRRSEILIPDLDRGLERAGNSRTPGLVKNQNWWRSLRAIAAELDAGSAFRDAVAFAGGTPVTGAPLFVYSSERGQESYILGSATGQVSPFEQGAPGRSL